MNDFIYYILQLLHQGLYLAIPLVLVCTAILVIVYRIFRKQKRNFPWKKSIIFLMLLGWFAITIYVTLLRGNKYTVRQWNFYLFLAWKQAWNQFTPQVWLNVLLNIALFVPLGICCPILSRKFHRWYVMLAVGFATTLGIELIQLITCMGMFDVDDLFTNTLGAMLGWGMVMPILAIIQRKQHWKKQCIAYSSVPLAFLIAMAMIFGCYALQPYGNISDAAVKKANVKDIQWNVAFTPEELPTTAMVYEVGRVDKAAGDAFGADFAKRMGIVFPDTYYYDDLIIFANHGTGDFLNLNQQNGTWMYSIGREKKPVFNVPATQINQNDIVSILHDWNMNIPEEATVQVEKVNDDFTDVIFTVTQINQEDAKVHGTLTCQFVEENGITKMIEVKNEIVTLAPYQEENILSPAQAVQKLCQGYSAESAWYQYEDIDQINVISCTLDWISDTKGFYQPIYVFEVQIPEQEPMIDFVPALA